jgi:hypothetical protein
MFVFLKQKRLPFALLACALAAYLLAAPRASSQTGGTYDLSWNTIDGGGITFASGGSYTLGGGAGAADAGVLSGGNYTLAGGFWNGASTRQLVYLPAARR